MSEKKEFSFREIIKKTIKYLSVFLLVYLIVRYVFIPQSLPTARLSHSKKENPLPPSSKIGAYLPPLQIKLANGGEIKAEDFKGNVLILNFFTTWCPSCRVEMPSLNNIFLKYKEMGGRVVGVCLDDSEDSLRQFEKEVKVDFPLGFPLYPSQINLFKIFGLPTTFIVDRRGVIREIIPGAIDWESKELMKRIEELLEEK